MREIKFRGKTKYFGIDWVYGYYFFDEGKHWIMVTEGTKDVGTGSYEVYPETVGQYTGLKDKNGKEVYEGDILRCAIEDPCTGRISRYFNCAVAYCKTMNAIGYYGKNETGAINKIPPQQDYLEVIGNIYDNPEKLKEE
jgi:uncharacterized phage protein (TIGR01671 family)